MTPHVGVPSSYVCLVCRAEQCPCLTSTPLSEVQMRKHLGAVVIVSLFACNGDSLSPVGSASPETITSATAAPAIADAKNGGRDGFYFLHPFVANPGIVGPFDATLAPRARVCALNATRTECAVTLATIPTASLTVDPKNGIWVGQWASPGTLALTTPSGSETRYRLEILLDVGTVTATLGYADLWIIDKQRDVRETPAGFVDLVLGKTLLFRFGILSTTVGYVVVTPNPVQVTIGGTQQMAAAAYDVHNVAIASPSFTWASDHEDLVDVSSSGLVTGLANGSANISATTGGVSGSAVVNVIGDPPVAPTAVADEPAAESAPGDAFHTAFNSSLSSGGTTPGLLENDVLGSPLATVVSFGGGSLGGTVASNAAGATVNFGTGGSLQVNSDGSFAFTPSTGFTGTFTFSYRIQNSSATSDASVTIAVGARPAAVDDTYPVTIIGNVSINTASNSNFSLLTNDAGDALTITLGISPNGTATINPDGTFTFNPAPGFTGTAMFSYTVQNGLGTSAAATVSIPVTTPIWFVNASAPAGGDGRIGSPFNCLVDAGSACYDDSANEAGDVLYIASGTYANSGALVLKATQRVIGQGAASTLSLLTGLVNSADSPSLPGTGGTAPLMTSAGVGVTLASDNQLHGFNVGNTGGAGISGNSFGNLTVREVSLPGPARSGQALGLSNGSLVAGSTFGALVSTAAADTGVGLADVSGSLTVTGGTTVAGSGMAGISVVNSTAGAFDFGNTSVSATGGTGVSLSSNVATVRFGDLDIAPNAGQRALVATGNSGKVTVTSGTIVTTGNGAVQVTGPTELSMVLTSVSANGGAAPGVNLSSTTGSFSIVGTGSAASGGTIANTTGAAAIALANVASVSLSRMVVQNNAGTGIHGTSVAGFAINNSALQNNGDDVTEQNLHMSELTGTASITSSTISNASVNNVLVENTAGSLTFSLSGSTLSGDATKPNARHGLSITAGGSAVVSASIGNNEFHGHKLAHFSVRSTTSAAVVASVIGNTLSCNSAAATACNAELISNSNGTFSYAVQSNVITGMKSVLTLGKISGTGAMTGSFTGNVIGESGTEGSGGDGLLVLSQADGVSHTTSITNNAVSNYRVVGIDMSAGAAGSLDASVVNNIVFERGPAAVHGFRATSGTTPTSTATMCLALSGNLLNGSGGSLGDFSLVQGGLATMRLPFYIGAKDDNTAVVAFVGGNQVQMPGPPTGSASNTVATGGGGFMGGEALCF